MENVTLKKMINAYGMVLILILLFWDYQFQLMVFSQQEQYGVLLNRSLCSALSPLG
ncbi:Uncharacterised protein [Rodentibacter pneumotropicus]|uniref:Uncharacterized protein n=1 Tax=Rodentibacter pneumotropicus TaxID=758 RepID=A0A448MT67_9PAST|nr:Uncharacterised protein [Rodentibacter pneumotropicus]